MTRTESDALLGSAHGAAASSPDPGTHSMNLPRGRPRAGGVGDSAFDPSPEILDRLNRAAWALCGSADDAEDLVQETFARVLARPRVLRRGDSASYLMRTLRNTYLTSLRTASRRPRTTVLPVEQSGAMASSLARPDVAIEFRTAVIAVSAIAVSASRTLAPRGGTRA